MAEATRSKSTMDQLEDVIAKLTSSHLSMSTKIDDLIHRMTQLETNQHNQHTSFIRCHPSYFHTIGFSTSFEAQSSSLRQL